MAVAALTIAFVRGFSLNFGVYYAVRESLGIAFQWNPIVVFITRSDQPAFIPAHHQPLASCGGDLVLVSDLLQESGADG